MKKVFNLNNLLKNEAGEGIIELNKVDAFIGSLTELEIQDFDKFLRHIKNGHPIDFYQKKRKDRSGRYYYFINQQINGRAQSGYKLMIFEGFDEFLDRLAFEELGFTSISEIKSHIDSQKKS